MHDLVLVSRLYDFIMTAFIPTEVFKLQYLSEDCFGLLSELLSSVNITKLYFCGDKSLISKLEKSVIWFNHHPGPRKQHYWPNIVSRFPRLLSFEFVVKPLACSLSDHIMHFKIAEAHYEKLPRTLTRLHLHGSNSLLSLLDPASSTAEILPLDKIFPQLRDFKVIDSELTKFPPSCWDLLLDLPLTKLHLKDVSVSITLMQSVWHSFEELEFTTKFEDPTAYPFGFLSDISCPSSLKQLRIYDYPAWFPMKFIPRSVDDLHLKVARKVFNGDRARIEAAGEDYIRLSLLNWSHLPPHLTNLEVVTFSISERLTADVARLLPRSLVKFTCYLDLDENPSSTLQQLPNGLQWLNFPSMLYTSLEYLPPNLTCVNSNILGSVRDASIIPKNLNSIANVFSGPNSQADWLLVDFDKFITLPVGLTSLWIHNFLEGDDFDFSKIDFSKRSHLVHLWVEDGGIIRNRSFWRSMNSSCRYIQTLKLHNFTLRDLTLLDELTFPLKSLFIQIPSAQVNFGTRTWAKSLEQLVLHLSDDPEPILTPLHNLQLPTSLTDLRLNDSSIIVPSSPVWPLGLKVLSLASAVPYEAFPHFPQSLVELGMHVTTAFAQNVDPQFTSALASLPESLTFLQLDSTEKEDSFFDPPCNSISSAIQARCPFIQILYLNDIPQIV